MGDSNLGNDQLLRETGQNISIVTNYLLAAAGPLLLLLAGSIIPLHYMYEEMWKLVPLVSLTSSLRERMNAAHAAAVGMIFGIFELLLFVINAFSQQNAEMLMYRFLFTVPMHGFSAAIMYVIGRRGGLWWAAGLVAATSIHGLFNRLVS